MRRPGRNDHPKANTRTAPLLLRLSRQFDAASEQTGIPVNWLVHNALKAEAENYLNKCTGYAEDSRPVWYAQRAVKIPIQVVKA